MHTARTSTLLFSALLASQLCGQFTLVNSSPQTLIVVGSLSSGMRYLDTYFQPEIAGTRTIYNQDLSVHRVLNYPAPPTNMRWANMGYITEALFDTDPSTIEFTMVAAPLSGSGNFGAFVFREDASEIFSQNPGHFTNSPIFNAAYGPIFSTPDGTFMTVHTIGVNGPPVNIYQLPGALPCMDCKGSPQADGIGMGGGGVDSQPQPGMSLLPNPADQEVSVRFHDMSTPDHVLIIDATGREVMRHTVGGRSLLVLSTSQLANGRYIVVARQGESKIGSLPLLIAR